MGLGVKHNSDDLSALRALIEGGEVTPVVGETYQLSEVPDAMRDLKGGANRVGKTVIAAATGCAGAGVAMWIGPMLAE